jgi:hypothetical protein
LFLHVCLIKLKKMKTQILKVDVDEGITQRRQRYHCQRCTWVGILLRGSPNWKFPSAMRGLHSNPSVALFGHLNAEQ